MERKREQDILIDFHDVEFDNEEKREKIPITLIMDGSNKPRSRELFFQIEDELKMGYLRKKYQKSIR